MCLLNCFGRWKFPVVAGWRRPAGGLGSGRTACSRLHEGCSDITAADGLGLMHFKVWNEVWLVALFSHTFICGVWLGPNVLMIPWRSVHRWSPSSEVMKVHLVEAPHRCILTLKHEDIYREVAAFWSQFYETSVAKAKTSGWFNVFHLPGLCLDSKRSVRMTTDDELQLRQWFGQSHWEGKG